MIGGRVYWGRKEKENRRGIAVIFSWISVPTTHLNTFVDFYSSLGWNSLLSNSDFLTAFYPDRALSLGYILLNELVEPYKKWSNHMSQLIEAIEKLCNHQYLKEWRCEMSIFKLLYILFIPEVTDELKHARMHSCDDSDAGKLGVLACYYVKEGKLIELAALFMIAHKKLISRTGSQRTDESMKIYTCIMSEFQILVNKEVSLMRSCLSRKSVKDKRMVLSFVLLLLEVFERAGHVLEKYLQLYCYKKLVYNVAVVNDVAFLLEKSGFVLKDKDIFVRHLS